MKQVGLISDTHMAGSGRSLPEVVLEALTGVDLILHCGDLECLGVLDYLETIAPVLAVRGYEDPTEPGDRLAQTTRVVQVEEVNIGMVHDIQWPTPRISTSPDGTGLVFPEGRLADILARKFGRPVERGGLWRYPRGTHLPLRRRAADKPRAVPLTPAAATVPVLWGRWPG